MKILRAIAFFAILALLASATLFGQERVVVMPPLAGSGVSEMQRNIVMSALSDHISSPGSGFRVYDREHTDAVLKELGEQRTALYDESSAKALGKRLGAQHVCISKLTKEGGDILIECKVINVETGESARRAS
jgi:hypothetical protein